MASADFQFDIRTPREARSQWHPIGSPQVRRTSFLPVHRIYVSDSCMSIGHWVFWPPHPSEPPHIRFLFVEHAFCYRLPPDLVLPLRPCRVANLPLIGRVRDLHPTEARHVGRTKKSLPGFVTREACKIKTSWFLFFEGTFNDNFRIFHDLTTLHEEVERFKILIHH